MVSPRCLGRTDLVGPPLRSVRTFRRLLLLIFRGALVEGVSTVVIAANRADLNKGSRMGQKEQFQALVAELGEALGIADLGADASGYFGLTVDGSLTVCLQYGEQDDQLTLFCTVCVLPATQRARALELLMHANLFWQGTGGATLGFDPADDMVVLARRMSASGLDATTLADAIQQHADRGKAWRTRLSELAEGAESQTAPTNAPPFADGMLRA